MKNTMKKPVNIPVEKLRPFEGHPFKVKDDAEMNTLIESIQTQGVLSPLIVRPIENTDEYEVISGHRRLHAAKKARIVEIPALIYALDRDSAAIAVVDSNLHREHILPSEKAFAYRCSNYKSGRGSCQIHFIRNVVLEKIVLEAINSLADFVRCYEPVFLYLMAQKDIVSKRTETSKLKTAIESGKRRIQDLDKLIERIYEDQVLGNISAERYARMSVNYENEQRTLINKVAEDEKKLACIEQTSLDLKTLLKVLRSSTSFEELTPTLVNSLIRRIEVHNNDKSSGHCYVKVDIYFTAIGLIDIPTEDEIKSLMAKIKANPQEYRLTA